jgi:C1A family cysteine protease
MTETATPTLTPRRIARLGWRPDTPDNRDKTFRPRRKVSRLPIKVDLRGSGFMPDVDDQLNLGSCTGDMLASLYEFEQKRQGLLDFKPSRLFIYYGEREIEGTTSIDAGAEIRDGMKVLNNLGVCDERIWPYDISSFSLRPPNAAYDDAARHQTVTYGSVPVDAHKVKMAVASGTPVGIGFSVYPWFEDVGPSGVISIPKGTQPLLGGHAVSIVGYEHVKSHGTRDYAIVRNSWGTSWGDQGYCYFPLAWLTDTRQWNADDFWAIQSVEA